MTYLDFSQEIKESGWVGFTVLLHLGLKLTKSIRKSIWKVKMEDVVIYKDVGH